jgi:deoxycytidine triphosphate deaminase
LNLISEAELRDRVLNKKVLVKNLSPGAKIRGCSVDLTIGEIYMPGTTEDELGSSKKPQTSVILEQGHTAVIRTYENVALTASQAAVVFPTSSVSLKGLLMTNPGHVDPGYSGHLHVTVINFGSKPYSLEKGGRLLRALFFEQTDVATNPLGSIPNPITDEL